MKVIVNDANILIDLVELKLLPHFFALEVHGHLWVFDRMVEADTITGSRACEKLSELCETINPKLGLPKGECARRIKLWEEL